MNYVPDFDTLVPAPELSLADAKNNPFRNLFTSIITHCIGSEKYVWSGNERVEIRYVHDSFVAGTSASSPGVPRHI